MDMLETGNGLQAAHANGREGTLTLDESITEFSMWAISASPLVVTTPIMNCTAEAEPVTLTEDCEGPTGERRTTLDPTPEAPKCSVSLTKQHSSHNCTLDKTFGCYDNKTMWAKGCRGVFVCDGVTDVVCDIQNGGTNSMQHCPCKKGNKPHIGPVGPPPPPNPVKHNCKGTLNSIQKIVLLNKDVIAINQVLQLHSLLTHFWATFEAINLR